MWASRRRPAYPSPEVRACDADRDQVIAELREHFADGSLAHESFVIRVDAALRARRHGELAEIVADLPGPRASRTRAVLERLDQAGRSALHRVSAFLQPPPPAVLMLPPGPGIFTIGRDAGCDLVLADMTVSRTHAGLRREGGGWLLSDAGSTNGTRVNGWRVTSPVPLQPGDRVTFGALKMVVAERAQHAGVALTP
jgi:hypothetical protein